MVKVIQDGYTDPKGKQILTLFRINRLVPFMDEHLSSVEKVIREHLGRTDSLAQKRN